MSTVSDDHICYVCPDCQVTFVSGRIRDVQVRRILTDLFRELAACQLPIRATVALHRAEQRLREVSGE